MPTLDSTPFEQFLNTLPESTRNDTAAVVTLTLDDLKRLVDAAYEDGFGDGFDEGVQADFDAEQENTVHDPQEVSDFFQRQAEDDARVSAFLDSIEEGGR